ncbi:1-deoxy-D-xylulose-5-phosphate reductoisomerase [Thermoflavimicrobium daqui]|uniref:1-deoxy-D-xylulose 5-phosphate reductoisomerase n=1 Tax=Thermoflavimicrobium daqui TaxID=2137476 RepID=A0A364K7Q9_9BACL|nr:1-deoxy-D-xylulose-5-phosphate reductoisomerase [Thermoflavimicrobium daqui]RAL26324.1 1-deoxy-D-xylulose-5-phosphate reductoisomerase [Thermoflavimicrobium daqui]
MSEKVVILGSTGSIGTNTLEVIRQHPEEFTVVALAAGTNVEEMIKQAKAYRPKVVSMATKEAAEKVRFALDDSIQVLYGEEGLLEVATYHEATFVVSAIVGSRGLAPTLAAIQAGKKIGLANKESLITAGHIITEAAKKAGVPILPIDSEHSALFQCLNGERKQDVQRLIVTASGGAFRDWSREQLVNATPADALKHPNWSMGPKVTVDSATLMNKGLEVMEAHWLFGFPYEQIEVLIHPQSIIHSMVEFHDGAIMAQLGSPDMKVPIQYALSYPKRLPLSGEPLDFVQISRLDFRKPDFVQYPCLKMAYEAGRAGGTMPTVLNAANEVAVEQFLAGEIPFLAIEHKVEEALSSHQWIPHPSLSEIEEADRWAREFAKKIKIAHV